MTMLKAALGSRSGSLLWRLACVSRTIEKIEQSCPAPDQAFVCPTCNLSCATNELLCFISICPATGFLLLGDDAIGKCSLSALPMGVFDGFGPETRVGFGVHTHRRLQVKRMKLS